MSALSPVVVRRFVGGDAPAAGSIGDREAVASGEDELFDDSGD